MRGRSKKYCEPAGGCALVEEIARGERLRVVTTENEVLVAAPSARRFSSSTIRSSAASTRMVTRKKNAACKSRKSVSEERGLMHVSRP